MTTFDALGLALITMLFMAMLAVIHYARRDITYRNMADTIGTLQGQLRAVSLDFDEALARLAARLEDEKRQLQADMADERARLEGKMRELLEQNSQLQDALAHERTARIELAARVDALAHENATLLRENGLLHQMLKRAEGGAEAED